MNQNFNTLKLTLQLRLKMLCRMFSLGGRVFGIIMAALMGSLLFTAYTSTNRYATLFIAILILFITDGKRGDKKFLALTFAKPRYVMMADYVVLSLPFLIVCMLKGEWWQMMAITSAALILPCLHGNRFRLELRVPLPFMYRGGIDLLYSIRIIWWLYPCILTGAVMGVVYDNINLSIVCTMLWTLFMCISMRDPTPLALNYGGLRPFIIENVKMAVQGAVIWIAPLFVVLYFGGEGISLPVRLLSSGVILVTACVFMRYVVTNTFFVVFNVIMLVFLYGLSVFCLWGYPVQIVVIFTYILLSKNKYSRLWN